MEFERGIYRMYERSLQNRKCSQLLKMVQFFALVPLIMSLVSFFVYQTLAVNKSAVLKTAMSAQLLAKYEDKTLPYS